MSTTSTTVQSRYVGTGTPNAAPVDGANYRAGIDQVRFWVGALLTAAIAALAGLVGLLLIEGILRVPLFVAGHHALLPVSLTVYALLTAGLAIGASALYNLMLHVAPHPTTYYAALAVIGTLLAVLLPFTVPVALISQAALAGLNLVVGLLITFLVPMAAVQARRSATA